MLTMLEETATKNDSGDHKPRTKRVAGLFVGADYLQSLLAIMFKVEGLRGRKFLSARAIPSEVLPRLPPLLLGGCLDGQGNRLVPIGRRGDAMKTLYPGGPQGTGLGVLQSEAIHAAKTK